MVTEPGEYRGQVFRLLKAELLGDLDGDFPAATIERLVDSTDLSRETVVFGLQVFVRRAGCPEVVRVFDFDEWVDYTDKSPASMAAGLAVLIRSELREELATSDRWS